MDDADFNAARRNLMLISIGFIIFYFGDGSLTDTAGNSLVSLAMTTVSFAEPYVLEIFAWILLAWYALRFLWLSEPDRFWNSFLSGVYNTYPIRKLHAIKGRKHTPRSNLDRRILWRRGSNKVQIFIAPGESPEFFVMKGTREMAYLYAGLVTAAVIKKEFGQYYLPWFLFLFACIIWAFDYIVPYVISWL